MWPLKSHRERQPAPAAPHLLAILSDGSGREAVTRFAEDRGWQLSVAGTIEEGHTLFRPHAEIAIVLVDRDLAADDWRSTVRGLAERSPRPSVILASSVIDPYLFDEVVKQGGFDVLSKPIQADELRRTALLAFKFRERRRRANG
jgi:DNA-binding NtrC family response regulator